MEKHTEEIAISVKNVNKTFRLPHEKQTSLKGLFLNSFRRKSYELQEAVKEVNFDVKKGEFFGIVGRNGSGKSTLLKCIAGVYTPTSGQISINGTLVPFIELGVGFNPDLSGRDNVFLNGALLGFNRTRMEDMYEDIVEFAELEQFMDQKLKNYSSGMQVRLAFSIAIRARGDILLLDEVLAVGDTAFQKKCNDYFFKLKDQGQTVVLVTHSMSAVEQFCDRALLLNEGKVVKAGNPVKIADLYNELNLRSSVRVLEKQNKKFNENASEKEDTSVRKAKIVSVDTYNTKSGELQDTFTNAESIGVKYTVEAIEDIISPAIGLVFRDMRNYLIFATNTPSQGIKLENLKSGERAVVEFEIDNVFTNSSYSISGAITSTDRTEVYHKVDQIHGFEVGGWKMGNGLTNPPHEISIKYMGRK